MLGNTERDNKAFRPPVAKFVHLKFKRHIRDNFAAPQSFVSSGSLFPTQVYNSVFIIP